MNLLVILNKIVKYKKKYVTHFKNIYYAKQKM